MDSILNLIFNNIEIIGVFIAIIGGLVASKIISLNTEKDEINNNLKDIEEEIVAIKKSISIKKKEGLENYKEYVFDNIIDSLIDDEEFDLYDYNNPFISNKEREKFYDYVKSFFIKIITMIIKEDKKKKEIFRELNLIKGSLDYKICEYICLRGENNGFK